MTLACALGVIVASPAPADPLRIVAFGDSLTAGLGLPVRQAFPAQLEAALKARGHDVEVLNAGVSGDTASAALARLDWAVAPGAAAVIVELGANDMLRGIAPNVTRDALDKIIARLKARNVEVLLAGMRAAPNLGADYVARFDAIYPELAKKHSVLFYPFFLDGIAADRALNQQDGVHPTARGIALVVERMLPTVEMLITRARSRKSG